MRALILPILTVGLALAPSPGQAGSPDPDAANAKAAEARVAYDKGQHADAAAGFRAAYQLDPRPVFLFWIAHVEETGGNYQEAIEGYRRYLDSGDEQKRAAARKKVHALQERWDREHPEVALVSDPAGAGLTIDDAEAVPSPWRGRLAAGAHTVTVKLEGYLPQQDAFVVEAGKPLSRRYTLEAESPSAAPVPEPDPKQPEVRTDAPPATSGGGDRALYGWVAVGGAGATLVGAVVFTVLWQGEEAEIDDINARSARKEPVSIEDRNDHEDAADRDLVLAEVLYGATVVLGATGAVLLLTGDDSPDAPSAALVPTPGGAAALVRF